MERSSKALVDACIYIDENEHTYRVQLDGRKTVIGTSPDCDVLLKDKTARGLVGEFIATRRSFEFRSKGLQSITLNGHTVRGTQRLYHGDVLAFGETRVRYFEVPEVSEVTLQFGIAGVHSGHAFFLTNQSFVRIGQTVGDLRIPDSTLDDPQVAIENLGPDATYVRQLGMESETTVNGVKLSERIPIRDGAVIQMGETHIVIRTIPDVPLPAPSETLLRAPDAEPRRTEDDEKQTAPEKLKTVRKAHIRAGGDLTKTSGNKQPPSLQGDPIAERSQHSLERSGAPHWAREGEAARPKQSRESIPTPQPYTIRQADLHQARRHKAPGNADLPYYLRMDPSGKRAKEAPPSEKPYYLRDGKGEPTKDGSKRKAPRPSEDATAKPYYVPDAGAEHRMGERNSPLDWMEGRPPEKDDEQAGSTIIFARDAVNRPIASGKNYYVPEREPTEPVSSDLDHDDMAIDRSGITLQDTSLEDLD